jgi:hypothetical protein
MIVWTSREPDEAHSEVGQRADVTPKKLGFEPETIATLRQLSNPRKVDVAFKDRVDVIRWPYRGKDDIVAWDTGNRLPEEEKGWRAS